MLDQYTLHPRRQKKKEEIFLEQRVFETAKTTEKVSTQTKELEFGGRIGMYVNNSDSHRFIFT